mmetsp:Transcript_22337/g.45595  ORF Transcript_22337/g.45595 Transcript_22337/m.45595 type:complete len:125 (+) Transcript_22337:601-975(+)
MKRKWTEMAGELQSLKDTVRDRIQEPLSNGRGGYAYDRNSVVQLTKLVCQDLENKPASINSNKIFECVRNIFVDLKKKYSDNPPHLYTDVRMLFGVCLASCTWFTDNQLSRLQEMAAENNWSSY